MARWRLLLALLAALAVAAPAAAGPPPPVSAAAYAVQSGVDGGLLAERAGEAERSMASITKLMTAVVVLDRANLDDFVTVTPSAVAVGGSTAYLRLGEELTVRDLLRAMLVPSANDAATALALHVGGGSVARFVELMNQKARSLGLRHTRFANPHGLDQPGHYSSARDTIRLLRAALRNPEIRKAAGSETATIPEGRTLESTDDLLATYAPLVAGKTGHTFGAGWSQVAVARQGGVTVYASVLGAPSREARNSDLERLLTWALAEHRRVKAVDARRTYARAAVAYGRPAVRLVAPATIVRPLRAGRPLVERVVAPTVVSLPVVAGQQLGEVKVFDGKRLIARSPLVAAESIERPGLAGKARWYATRTAHHLAGLLP